MHSTEKILTQTSNRLYSLPERKWKSYQEWHDVLMLHWMLPAKDLENLIPEGLELDTINGKAWVTWISFTVKKTRGRHLLPLSLIPNFEEVNLRTYVTCNGRPGIYLLSVEKNKFLPVLLNRIMTGIPYVTSMITRRPGYIRVYNDEESDTANLIYSNTEEITDKEHLDLWLTERHCLYMAENEKLYCYNIHHKEWSLRNVIASVAKLKYKVEDLTVGKKIPNKKHFAKKAEVLLWGKELVNT